MSFIGGGWLPGVRALALLLCLGFAGSDAGKAQQQDKKTSVALVGAVTTTSKLFPNTNNPDAGVRNQFLPINGFFSFGVQLRHDLPDFDAIVGVDVEYLSSREDLSLQSGNLRVPVADGFTAIPVEISGMFRIPIGDEKFRLYMGGGGGVYFGSRDYSIGTAIAPTIERSTGFGIHILSGFQYQLSGPFALRTEVKFRDVQFETSNQFSQPTTIYSGTVVQLPQDPLMSRVNIDGMNFSLGLVYSF